MHKHDRVSKTTFTLDSARATLHHADDGTARLSNLFVQQKGNGHASALLNEIIDYADKHNLSLWLEVQRYGDPRSGLDNQQLIRLYEKFGFEILDNGRRPVVMIREPLLKGEE